MAIKFVDIEPEPGPKKTDTPPASRDLDAEALDKTVKSDLPHPKLDLKPRGRKKPLK